MQRTTYWRLTISFFQRAIEAGMQPRQVTDFPFGESPACYRPHTIDFRNPPSRQDFLDVVRQTPWMSVWEADLLPVVACNEWPMIDPAHKGATVELKDEKGRIVGRLEVWREERFDNPGYAVPILLTAEIRKFLNRRIRDKAKRAEALTYVTDRRNVLLERIAQQTDQSDMQLLDEVERLLVEAGMLGKNRVQ